MTYKIVIREVLCPVHSRATVDRHCHDCLIEARDAVQMIESGVAGANVWASSVLHRHCGPRKHAA